MARPDVNEAVRRRRAQQKAQEDYEAFDSTRDKPKVIAPVKPPTGPKRRNKPVIRGGLVTGRTNLNTI